MEKNDQLSNFGINDDNLLGFVDSAKDYAIYKGILIRHASVTFDARIPVSFCLVPSPFPSDWYGLVKDIQPHMNYVLHQVAHSPKFLKHCLERVIKVDDFTAQIWKIYETVQKKGTAQPCSLGLLRCDYMLDTSDSGEITGIKQVENNTVATSFANLSCNMRDLHVYTLSRCGVKDAHLKIPENDSSICFVKGIISAWDVYGQPGAAILCIVEDITYNVCDQRALEFKIWEVEKDIEMLRFTFTELRESASFVGDRLFVNDKEIAVVYYRCGYVPEHYTPEDWELRLKMEKSRAIKCPTAGYHLAGTKRVQLELTKPGVLENFLPEDCDPKIIRDVFKNQYSLSMDIDGDKAVKLALENPHKYVLKPEREGGGNNIYGEDIKELLESIGSIENREAYILMEKIKPPSTTNYIVQAGSVPESTSIISELGIYGVILGRKNNIFSNYAAGYVVKSKGVTANEGGITAGFGALDSPYLY